MMTAFRDFIGTNQMMAYLVMMAVRLLELRRVLRQTGSIYLHCDPTASHFLKILMDTIFGPDQFRNEIVWRRTGSHNSPRSFGPIHDIVLFYTKSNSYFFNVVKRPYMRGHVETRYKEDDSGRSKFTSGGNILTGSGIRHGDSGLPWRGFDPTSKNRHWAIPGFLAEQMPSGFEDLTILEKLEALYKAKLVEITDESVWPTPVRYLSPGDGQPVQDIWAYQPYTQGTVYDTENCIDQDVAWLGPTDPERLGYDTQKPLGLLERIINASCPEDGTVLDPFCGCGTAIAAAQKLGRKWIGIDITHLAIALQKNRLKGLFALEEDKNYVVVGEPPDIGGARELAKRDRYQFQWWALSLIPARPIGGKQGDKKGKKGSDKGIDGDKLFFDDLKGKPKRALIQVKSGHVKSGDVRDLHGTVDREKAAMGIIITLEEPSRDMKKEAAAAGFYHSDGWNRDYPKIQILTVQQLLNGEKPQMPPPMCQ